MFQNVLMAITPLCDTNEIYHWQNQPFSKEWSTAKQWEPLKGSSPDKPLKRKMKRTRTSFTTYQLDVLETTFTRTKFIDRKQRIELANNLKISERCIKTWFQNKRMREKKATCEISENSSDSVIVPVNPSPRNVIISHSHQNNAVDHQFHLNYHNYCNSDKEMNSKQTDYVCNLNEEFSNAGANYYHNYNSQSYPNYKEHLFTNDPFQANAGTCSSQYYNFTNAESASFYNQSSNNSEMYLSADNFLLDL